MELLLVLLIVLVAVALLRRGGPTWYRRGPRRVARYDDAPIDDMTVVDRPVRRRRVIEDL